MVHEGQAACFRSEAFRKVPTPLGAQATQSERMDILSAPTCGTTCSLARSCRSWRPFSAPVTLTKSWRSSGRRSTRCVGKRARGQQCGRWTGGMSIMCAEVNNVCGKAWERAAVWKVRWMGNRNVTRRKVNTGH
eukprot:358808-Chlamydomonas_euryale.AAC.3